MHIRLDGLGGIQAEELKEMATKGTVISGALLSSLIGGFVSASAHAQFVQDGWGKLSPTEPAVSPRGAGGDPGSGAKDVGASRGLLVPLPSPALLGAAGLGIIIVTNRRRRS